MDIKMVGIDHNKAKIEDRELFAFTQSHAIAGMERLKRDYQVEGCVLISTCNRTELWLSGCKAYSPWDLLCKLKEIDPRVIGDIYVEREGRAAVEHLMELACGLKSKVFGEDQIITQLKQGLDLARDCHSVDSVLETCFRMAISGGKKVKTYVRLTPYDSSVATSMINRLRQIWQTLEGLRVLVVGNGEMGRIAAKSLLTEGCQVTMTLRQYKQGNVVVPEGCQIIPYKDRLDQINGYQLIVSVTASPHYTFHSSEVLPRLDSQERVWIDLAVPRDIDPAIGGAAGNILYDIDSIGGISLSPEDNPNVAQAKAILLEYQQDFENWYYFRDLIPMVQNISQKLAEEVAKKSKYALGHVDLDDAQRKLLQQELHQTTHKAMCNLLYGVKDNLSREYWQECFAALEHSVRR